MEIAILVFFLAIFGGVLFLLALIWFIFRRVRNAGSPNRKFSGSANYAGGAAVSDEIDSDYETDAVDTNYSTLTNQEPDIQIASATAADSAAQSDNTYSHADGGASAAPVETSYTESRYSSYESSTSYDSSSSSDSGSSSSDSGSSSSSSD